MWIAADTLLFASAVLLNSIGMISPQLRTLEDIFPGYNGVLPPVEEIQIEHQFPNFLMFGNRSLEDNSIHAFKRGNFIFGLLRGYDIFGLCRLFRMQGVFIVFDTNTNQWITLPDDLEWKFGLLRRKDLVIARDEVAATHVSTSTDPVYKEAHLRACAQANKQADIVERRIEIYLNLRPSLIDRAVGKIKREYSQAYNRAFMLHLHQHGEYHIHGYRERPI